MSAAELRIDAIAAADRHRSDLGDIKSLAASIDDIGLIQPVVVTPDHRLVAGGRRIAAVRSLGWETVPVTVIHTLNGAADLLQAELEENTCRKDLNPVEAAELRKSRAELLAPIVEQERRDAISDHGGRAAPKKDGGNFPPSLPKSKTRDVAAKGTGYSGKTLDKVDKVVETAADESQPEPVRETARQALNEIANTGKVDGPFKRTEEAKQDSRLAEILDSDADIARAKYRQALSKALANYLELLTFDPEKVADAIDAEQWQVIPMQIDGVNKWWQRVAAHRAGLKVVGGTDV